MRIFAILICGFVVMKTIFDFFGVKLFKMILFWEINEDIKKQRFCGH